MRAIIKFGLLSCLGAMLLLGVVGTPITLYGETAVTCKTAEGYVRDLLPSIPDNFTLLQLDASNMLGAAEANELSIPIPNSAGVIVNQAVILDDGFSLRVDSFDVKLNGSSPEEEELPSPLGSLGEERSFHGKILGNGSSLVALYIQGIRQVPGSPDQQPGFISGFVLEDKNDPTKPWYFIEPLKPLLRMAVAASYKNPGVSITATEFNNCILNRIEKGTHIIYRAGDAVLAQPPSTAGDPHFPLRFRINLDPVRHTEKVSNDHVEYKRQAPLQVPVGHIVQHYNDDDGVILEDCASGAGSANDGDCGVVVRITAKKPLKKVTVDEFFPGYLPPPLAGSSIHEERGTLAAGETFEFGYSFTAWSIPGSSPIFGTLVSEDSDGVQETLPLVSEFEVVSPLPESSETYLLPSQTIPIVAVGDAKFYDLYASTIQEKAWWEGEEEVLNLVSAFYQAKIKGLTLKVRGLEAWKEPTGMVTPGESVPDGNSDGNPDINAYNLLCHFAQGEPPPAVSEHTGGTGPMIHFLFSGYNFGSLPKGKAVADFSTHICQDTCGSFGNDIVGLAEGIGGLQVEGSTDHSCSANPDELAKFKPFAHHALSQQAPKPNVPIINMCFSPPLFPFPLIPIPCPPPPNDNFQATLYQRFLLVAHEMGHILGAGHADDEDDQGRSIMHSHLSNAVRFEINNHSLRQIIYCLEKGCP